MLIHLRFTTDLVFRLAMVVICALVLARRPELLIAPNFRLQRGALTLLSVTAVAYLLLGALTLPLNDDEVYHLVTARAAWCGEAVGDLPMRALIMMPFLALPVSPSISVLLGRAVIIAGGLLCGLLISRSAARLGAGEPASFLAGILGVIWLRAETEWVFLRPEYFATVCLMLGVVALLEPADRWSIRTRVTLAFAAFGLMASISHRHIVVIPFAVLSVCVALAREDRTSASRAMSAGLALALIPSLAYLLFIGSIHEVVRFHIAVGTTYRPALIGPYYVGAVLPLPILLVSAVSAVLLWQRRDCVTGSASVAILWLGVFAAAALNPIKLWFANASFVCLSALVSAMGLSALSARPRRLVFVLVILLTPPLVHHDHGFALPPRVITERIGHLLSQLQLIDWLGRTAAGGSVVCVVPYHPIRAGNAWRLYHAHFYCYVCRTVGRDLDPALLDTLLSGAPKVIQWDPWPEYSEHANLLEMATAHGFVPAGRVAEVARALASRYRLVRWRQPLPTPFGGGRFLVRRDLPMDAAVEPVRDPALER